MTFGLAPVKTALISVFDKTGAAEFASELHALGVKIISTGGTAHLLKEKGIPAQEVSKYTGFPELLEGRVKTLHPKIHAGVLYRRGLESDEKTIRQSGIEPIDLVAVNLYPQGKEIDVGGPALARAAAKNHEFVTVVTDPQDYPVVVKEIREKGGTSLETRKRLAEKAFELTAAYDAEIARQFNPGPFPKFSSNFFVALKKIQDLRYGENPHQKAAWYAAGEPPQIKQLGGKQLSYNNILDADAALSIAMEFPAPESFAVIVKHTNPCGAATARTLAEAFEKALSTDPGAAFGGIVAFNKKVDAAAAEVIGDRFVEIVAAPGFEKKAVEALEKKKSRRLLDSTGFFAQKQNETLFRSALGGVLVQSPDESNENFVAVTKKKPGETELKAALFGWKIVKHVKSNAIVFAAPDRTIGIGVGQMSRIDSCRMAVEKAKAAGLEVKGTAMASDAFLPFRDSVDFAASAGAATIIQPGGSVKDKEVIAAADEHGLSMIFTGTRHFKH